MWITPAYAGKTATDRARVGAGVGSPPRMRERPLPVFQICSSDRITPAYAGKTIGLKGEFEGEQDHPRVCGKDLSR